MKPSNDNESGKAEDNQISREEAISLMHSDDRKWKGFYTGKGLACIAEAGDLLLSLMWGGTEYQPRLAVINNIGNIRLGIFSGDEIQEKYREIEREIESCK